MPQVVNDSRFMMCRSDDLMRVKANRRRGLVAVGLALVFCQTQRFCVADGPAEQTQPAAAGETKKPEESLARHRKRLLDTPVESDSWTFRPTVVVRHGSSQGSGTIIASLEGETLVLTAAHVIRGRGPIVVELHRYNLGIEHQPTILGQWPRYAAAETVGSDNLSDLAVLRIRDMIALPFVARLGAEEAEPASNAGLTSVGIDLGTKLSSWTTQLVEVLWFELNDSGTERPFLVTERIPEHGRSGGGLFDKSGKLVGVCVGHAELVKGKRMGVFSSIENVRQLLREQELISVIERSEERRKRLARSADFSGRRLARPSGSVVTPTDVKHEASMP
jgi:S1-C subfamily serine protease